MPLSSGGAFASDHIDALSALWTMDEAAVPRNVIIGSDHKTVIVLDHSPNFAASSNSKMEIMVKDSATGQLRVGTTVGKTLWTCATESALEFRRIVDEIYPDGSRLIRFVISDFVARFLAPSWGNKLVEQDELLSSLSACGVPDAKADAASSSIINGISMAVEAVSELSELQKKHRCIFEKSNESPNASGGSILPIIRRGASLRSKTNGVVEKLKVEPTAESKDFRNTRFSHMKRVLPHAMRSWFSTDEGEVKKSTPNMGSIVVFTTINSDEEVSMIVKHVSEEITNRNKIISALDGDKNFASISHVQLYVVSLHPVGSMKNDTAASSRRPLTKVNEHLSYSVVRSEANEALASVVHGVVLEHYDLASTTVTSIPMKEEAQQGQSANYDVEIFHPRRSHRLLEERGIVGAESKLRCRSVSGPYDTVKLAWSTPNAKTKWDQFVHTVSALPISPASIHSRPSVCLTSYLLANRNVMLEVLTHDVHPPCTIAPNVGQKLISHLLISHAGRIYLHTVWLGKHAVLNDSEFANKVKLPKAATLRVSDFAALMKDSRLCYPTSEEEIIAVNTQAHYNERARKHLRRITRYWPIKLCDTFIYNIPKRFEPLLSLVRKSELSTGDVNKCRECICALVAFRDSKELLTSKNIRCNKLKSPNNKDEQFRLACDELLSHLRNYVNHSERHLEVFNMFLQISGLDRTTHISIDDVSLTEHTNSSGSATQSVRSTGSASPAESYRSMSRSNSPLPKKARKAVHMWSADEVVNVAELFNERYQREYWSKWRDFVGREQAGSKPAHLYPNLELSKVSRRGEVDPG
uniref:Protein asunder n=1 Tax=Parascaris univalens TaxID=6257 RepID=A0A915CA18_PARUN